MKLDLNDYFYFVHVVEKQGYTAAASALQMPKSRLSRHVAQLEERLGVRLLQRTSRNVTITEQGKDFYQHARKLVDAMEMAESAMQNNQGELSGKIVISCSNGVAQYGLCELFIEFAKRHPRVHIEQRVTNSIINLVADGVDIAIRGHSGDLPDSSLIQRGISQVDWPLFAAPSLIETLGEITLPTDLSQCSFLKIGRFNQQNTISLIHHSGQQVTQTVIPALCSEDMTTLKRSAVAAMGITSLPSYVCRKEVLQGQLIRILPDWLTQSAKLSLVMPSRLGVPAHVSAFADFLRSELPKIVKE